MIRCAFIGDALTGAGFRLAGASVHQPDPTEIPALFERLAGVSASGSSSESATDLILMTPEAAASLPAGRLGEIQRRGRPLVLVVPDVRGRHPAPDLVAALHRQLGLGA